jgi:hypothetical protein
MRPVWVSALTFVSTALPLLIAFCLSARSAHAQERSSMRASAATDRISIDARLDEPEWSQAAPATGFRQFEPLEGAPATQETEVRILYGLRSLYVGALLHDSEPAAVSAALGRRDDFNRADWFLVSIDSYLDRRTAYTFGVNAAGVQFDAVRAGGGGGPGGGGGGGGPPGMDASWDAVWSSAARLTPEGWVVEMEIPYSMLRFPDAAAQSWGIQFTRNIPRLGEQSEWPLVPRAQRSNLVAQFGLLTGIEGIEPRRNLQLRPYSVARLHTSEAEDRPGEAEREGELDIGGDLKVGLGPNVTLDATINPDFGQVEADPAVLNLSAFENIFEERRPFFLEGSQIYRFEAGPGQLLYTRRIGANRPIIGAAKLSGRTTQGLSFGVLGATTGNHFKPDESYGIARLSQQIGSFSSAGGILTAYDGPESAGRKRSLAAGTDWDLRFLENRLGIEGFAALTNRSWTQADRDTETGFAGKIWANKRQGSWQGFGGVEVYSDLYNPNEVGQARQNNSYTLIASIDHDINHSRPFGPFQRASIDFFGLQKYSYLDGLDQGMSLELQSRWMLRSFNSFELGAGVENPFGGYDIYETRGLGPWARPASVELNAEYDTDERRSWRVGPEVGLVLHEQGGREYGAVFRGNWNVSDNLALEGHLRGEWEDNVLAWSSNETFLRSGDGWAIGRESGTIGSDPDDYVSFDDQGTLAGVLAGIPSPDGVRFQVPVFGARDSRSLDLTARGTYTFTPDVSFQFYSQFFLAGGRYSDMGILRSRDDLARFDAFPKRDEFSLSSLHSNAVLRWEYRPGSTIYAVWTHGRQADAVLNPLAPWGPSPFDRRLTDQIGDTFDIFPDNILLIKLSYTFLN